MEDIITLYVTGHPEEGLTSEVDSRSGSTLNQPMSGNLGPGGFYGAYDWKVWNGTGYGQLLQRSVKPGPGYSLDVHDCGQYISATAHYQNPATGKKISQAFLIVLNSPDKGDGTVFLASTKWRTVSSVNQAASYISSTIQALASRAKN